MKKISMILIAMWMLTACGPLRTIRWRQPGLDDSAKFKNSSIAHAKIPFKFIQASGQSRYQKLARYLDTLLEHTNTNAFLIIKNDSILYERYGPNSNAFSLHASFSVAKSYIGTLIGIAVDKKIITSTNDLVIKYLPELAHNDKRFAQLTIQHLLDMRSGVDFDEDKETPFSGIAKLYYGTSLNNQVAQLKMKANPGRVFEYQSINTQVLATILERTTGKKIPDLLRAYLWEPLGAASDALWSLDSHNTVRAFCCLNATAADFAKLGRLYLHKGNWEGKQIVSKEWVASTVDADTLYKRGYKNQWWACNSISYFKDSLSASQMLQKLNLQLPISKLNNGTYYFKKKSGDYRAEGILGQIVYVNPDNNVIIVRMGDYPNKNLYFNGLIPKIGREL